MNSMVCFDARGCLLPKLRAEVRLLGGSRGAACFVRGVSSRISYFGVESRYSMELRLSHTGCCVDARKPLLIYFSRRAHEVWLMHAFSISLPCSRYHVSSFCGTFGGVLAAGFNSSHRMQSDSCVKVQSSYVPTIKGDRNSKSKLYQDSYSLNDCIEWWIKKMEQMKKPVVKELIKKLCYSNLLGLDEKLRNGSFKDGTLNGELLQVKKRFPHEVLLCRVGEFYEAVGFDACVLVECASLNPMSGQRNDMVPRAGFPVMNLRQTLDALTSSGYSVCVYEELRGPFQGRQRKDRFVSGHAHPGVPYVYGLAEGNIDLDLTEEVFVTGISRSATGYRLVFVSEMMRTFSVEEGLTEEAAVAKLRTRTCYHVFLHRSLKDDFSGLFKWREYGEGGMLWAECQDKTCEWFDHDPVLQVISKVKDLYSIDVTEEFREVVRDCIGRPKPLNVGTATHIGIIQTVGVPSLVKVLLPRDATGLCCNYIRDLLLNPPEEQVARSIQDACKLISLVTCAVPEFTCISAAKLVKLISSNEANHLELSRLRDLVEDVIAMHNDQQLKPILETLIGPTSSATGIKTDCQTLVNDCSLVADKLNNALTSDDDPEDVFTSVEHIPDEFFQTMEYPWRGRIKQKLADSCYEEVQSAAQQLSNAVQTDFRPVLMYVRASDELAVTTARPEIIFSRDNDAIWLKVRNAPASILKEFHGLFVAHDAKGKRVKESLYTSDAVEAALERYRAAVLNASCRVYEVLRGLAEELKQNLMNIVFASVLTTITKALFAHVSEARRRNWTFPKLVDSMIAHEATPDTHSEDINNYKDPGMENELILKDLMPYWLDSAHNTVICNTVNMSSMILLTGPNGGGKSSLLRSICAAALLGMCGLMVPAASANIPRFDSLMLRMMPQDSPADGQSSFQMEMSQLRSVLCEADNRSLVLIDEVCRGTEVQKGTALAASVIEYLDSIGCMGILSTHLHGLLDMQLNVRRLVFKAMGTVNVDGILKPTWKMKDGWCRESLAFETARSQGVQETVIERAGELYKKYFAQATVIHDTRPLSGCLACTDSSSNSLSTQNETKDPFNHKDNEQAAESGSISQTRNVQDELLDFSQGASSRESNRESQIFEELCRQKVSEIYKRFSSNEMHGDSELVFTTISGRKQPPPGVTGCSCVYLMARPDGRFYVGQTDNISGRIKAHRSRPGLKKVTFVYVQVSGKSAASELETFLINELPRHDVELVNKCDQFHRHFGTRIESHSQLPF